MSSKKLKLGVNIDHVATLREVRKTSYPDIVEAARLCESAGASAITVHLREDRRHINDRDVYALKRSLKVRMNLEMANSPEIVAVALKVGPDEVCLVPERRAELTTEGGLDVVGNFASLKRTVKKLSDAGIIVSLFIDPEEKQIKASAATGAPWIEMHTGCFCNAKGCNADKELKRLIRGAECAHRLGLSVNAGHGINLDNVSKILQIPYLSVLNIGHSIVCRAVISGLKNAVKEMLAGMDRYEGGVISCRGHHEKR